MSRHKKLNIISLSLLAILILCDVWMGLWPGWYILLLVFYVSICSFGAFVLSANLFLPAICKGVNTGKQIALTFDDGPLKGHTDRILDILAENQVAAAFFCIGNRVDQNNELLLRIERAGHLVGNHTYYHKGSFGFASTREVMKELNLTDTSIEAVLGKRPRFFRPPFGVTNPMIGRAVKTLHYKAIGWSIRSFDTIIKDRNKLWKRVTASLTPGDIVLFHDYSNSMIEILPDFIRFVRSQGYEIVRLDTLLNEKAYR